MTGTRWTCVLNICAAAALMGCGGSKGTGEQGLGSMDGGLIGDAGPKGVPVDAATDAAAVTAQDGATVEPPITPLADNSAGKACTSDAPCGGGTCATAVMSGGAGIAALLGGGASSTPAPGGYCTGPCRSDTDCGANGVCVGAGGGLAGLIGGLVGGGAMTATPPGECQATCSQSTDCREGYSCGAFMVPTPDGGTTMAAGLGGLLGGLGGAPTTTSCQPLPAADQLKDKIVGAACSMDSDCGGGTCATSMGMGASTYPDGYCSGRCLSDKNCGAGGVCLPPATGTGAGTCYASCSSDAECTREGYRCRGLGNNVRGCGPAAKPLPDNVVGQACSSDTACGGNMGSCVTSLPAAGGGGGAAFGGGGATSDPAPGGYCSNQCAEDADCGAGGVCVGASMGGFGGTQVGTCFKRCTTSDNCRGADGYGCELRGAAGLFGGGGGAARSNVCVPIAGGDAGT
jgi:hypothetical protein